MNVVLSPFLCCEFTGNILSLLLSRCFLNVKELSKFSFRKETMFVVVSFGEKILVDLEKSVPILTANYAARVL